jgi:hypothetical protein
MTDLTDKQRAAIERIDAKLERVAPDEQKRRMKAALSVSRQEVEASLAEGKAKRGKGKPT